MAAKFWKEFVAMITLIDGFPDDVVAVRADEQVTTQDYDKVLIPAVEDALDAQQEAEILLRNRLRFHGYGSGRRI